VHLAAHLQSAVHATLSPLAAIPAPPISGFEIGPLDIRFYGVLIALGAFLALQWMVRRYESMDGDAALAERAALAAILFGFLGARIGYVIPRIDRFIDRPLDIFAIWQGGLALFGGLTAGTIAVIVVTRRGDGDVRAMADAVAPALPFAQAIGRWGNYFNQELYGRPTDLPWALQVDPLFRRPAEFANEPTFHPTFLYESLWNLTLVLLLVRLDRRRTLPRGALILVYAVGYGLGRFLTELLRIDTVERYAGLSRNNWLALLLILIGIAGLLRMRSVAQGTPSDVTPAASPSAEHAAMSDQDSDQAPEQGPESQSPSSLPGDDPAT
jgi:prolipoprotein diacylglyceryl transferase